MKPIIRKALVKLKTLSIYLLILCTVFLVEQVHYDRFPRSPDANLIASSTIPGSIKKTPKVGFFKRLKYVKQALKKDLKDVIQKKRRENKGLRIFLVLALCGLVAVILLVLSFAIGYSSGSESFMRILLLLSLIGVLLLAFFLIRGVVRDRKP